MSVKTSWLQALKKVGNILLHPISIALFLSIVICWLFLPEYGKYKAEVVEQRQIDGIGILMYDDLDGNGYSDRLVTSQYTQEISALNVALEPSVLFQEWNFHGSYKFGNDTYLSTLDYDGNGRKEIAVFVIDNDSIFLNYIEDPFSKVPAYRSVYVDRLGTGSDTVHVALIMGNPEDLNRDGYQEIVFAVTAGFSLTPRKVYAYDIRHDTLFESPAMGYHILDLLISDITGDKSNEIIVNGYASMNTKDPSLAVDDSCAWLIVLNSRLEFQFPPVEFENHGYSKLSTFAIRNPAGYSDMYSLYLPPLLYNEPALLLKFDSLGRQVKTSMVPDCPFGKGEAITTLTVRDKDLIAICDDRGQVRLFDTSLQVTDHYQVDHPYYNPVRMDINGDGVRESMVLASVAGKLIILRENLSAPVTLPLNIGSKDNTVFSIKMAPGEKTLLSMDNGNNACLIRYERNPMWYGRWGLYSAIFLAIYFFIQMIGRIQTQQIHRKLETEKRITELQLKVVRNQMDPHFTMNAINSVIAAVQRDEKDQATQSLVHFSRIFRALVLSGDKIERTLAEEIDFVRNYLDLERFRFSNTFEYDIVIDPDVNLEWKVPKMIIQSPVENAVKHGLLPKSSGGRLTLRVYVAEGQLVLEVGDNGVGRTEAARIGSDGTRQGLKIMEEFLDLYRKTHRIRIEWEVIDLRDEERKPVGTKVVFRISAGNPKG